MIKRTSLVVAAIAAGMLFAPQAISAAEIKIASFPGPKHPVNARMLSSWVDKVNATSSGPVSYTHLTLPTICSV